MGGDPVWNHSLGAPLVLDPASIGCIRYGPATGKRRVILIAHRLYRVAQKSYFIWPAQKENRKNPITNRVFRITILIRNRSKCRCPPRKSTRLVSCKRIRQTISPSRRQVAMKLSDAWQNVERPFPNCWCFRTVWTPYESIAGIFLPIRGLTERNRSVVFLRHNRMLYPKNCNTVKSRKSAHWTRLFGHSV